MAQQANFTGILPLSPCTPLSKLQRVSESSSLFSALSPVRRCLSRSTPYFKPTETVSTALKTIGGPYEPIEDYINNREDPRRTLRPIASRLERLETFICPWRTQFAHKHLEPRLASPFICHTDPQELQNSSNRLQIPLLQQFC